MSIEVSLIVPVYNGEKYLKRCLGSIERQLFDNFEAIIVNDGSTDNTQAIIEEFCNKHGNFRCVTKPNGGISDARNIGIEHARGKYIVFADSDDTLPKEALLSQYETITREAADLAIGMTKIIDNGDRYVPRSLRRLCRKSCINRFDIDLMSTASVCNKIYKKSIILENNLKFKTGQAIYEDGIFNYQYYLYCKKISGNKCFVYNYIKRSYVNGNNLTLSQALSIESLEKRKIAYQEDIVESINKMYQQELESASEGNRELVEKNQKALRTASKKRYIRTLLVEVYSRIWSVDDLIIDKITELIDEEFTGCTEEEIEKICKDFLFFNEDKKLKDKSEILDEAYFTVIIFEELTTSKLQFITNGLFGQGFPFFELIVSKKVYKNLPENIKSLDNVNVMNALNRSGFMKKAVSDARGTFTIVLDNALAPNRMTFKNIYTNYFVRGGEDIANKDYIKLPLRKLNSKLIKDYKELDGEYGSVVGATFNDSCIGNIVLFTKSLKDNNIKFCNDYKKDIDTIYSLLNGIYDHKISMIKL